MYDYQQCSNFAKIISIVDDLTKDHRGKVTFINFLDFLIKQQQGMDPFDEVVKVCFKLTSKALPQVLGQTWPAQTMYTQIRRRIMQRSDQGLHCLSFTQQL